ncbi:MAG: peptide deformylase [Betaproteobacteria bacterium AqS2]|uniref:Peptide deformylase n=1 Tax=Candidatus Amphirhobacter heronislandensis TaxID=1732024 RepID=A0A930Y253_9GAMM|nr:peptide deformylase [Betaproteobacteria bacterium AqS2]
MQHDPGSPADRLLAYPHAALRAQAAPVKEIDDGVRALAARMLETMYAHSGIGLAANQVGAAWRVFVYDLSEERNRPAMLANPAIVAADSEKLPYEEGCLSLLEARGTVKRPQAVTIEAIDVASGEPVRFDSKTHLEAVCLQHEIDHLDGVLFFDHMSRLQRDRLLKRYDKACAERAQRDGDAAATA